MVAVTDHAPAGNATPHGGTTGANGHGVATLVQGADDAGIPVGCGVAVISGLARRARLVYESGVSVRISWPSAAAVG